MNICNDDQLLTSKNYLIQKKKKKKTFRKTLYLLSFKRIYFLNSPFVLLVPTSHTSEEETDLGTPILDK